MENNLNPNEKREFPRQEFFTPLAYKVCKTETLTKLFEGYTINVSQSGVFCNLKNRVKIEDVVWLSFNKSVLVFCEDLERHGFFYQNGVIGKVVRVNDNVNGTFDVGVNFITREEKNITNRIPEFLKEEVNEQSQPE